MLPLGEIHFDFEKKMMTIPAQLSILPESAPNMFFTQSKTLGINVWDKHSEGMISNDSVCLAGVGGTHTIKTISTSWAYSVDGKHFFEEPVTVNTTTDGKGEEGFDFLFGLPSLTCHNRVTINFKDMWIQFSE